MIVLRAARVSRVSPAVPPAPAAAPTRSVIGSIVRTIVVGCSVIDRRSHHVAGWRSVGAGRRRIAVVVIGPHRAAAQGRWTSQAEIGRDRIAVLPVPGNLAPAI